MTPEGETVAHPCRSGAVGSTVRVERDRAGLTICELEIEARAPARKYIVLALFLRIS